MELLRVAVLVGCIIGLGLMAGVFFAFSVSVMPGLGRTDDRTFVAAFQSIDRAIVRPPFLSVFLGTVVLIVAAALLHLGEGQRTVLVLSGAAFVLYLAAFIITGRVNVPMNDELKAAGDPDEIDVAAVRGRFDEDAWVRWNTVRTLVTTAALGCMVAAAMVGA